MRFFSLFFFLCSISFAQPYVGAFTQPVVTGNLSLTVANESTTGTTANTLTKLTGAPSTAIISTAGDTGGAIGITTAGAGKTGNATVTLIGSASCVFDGATTADHYVQISAGTNGDCTDAGATYPTSGQVIGRVLSTNVGAGTYTIDLFSSEIKAATPTTVGPIYSQTQAVTISGAGGGSVTNSSNALGSPTLAANFFSAKGTVLHFRLGGAYSLTSTATQGYSIAVTLGGTQILSGALPITVNQANSNWYLNGDIVCISTGSSGTVRASMMAVFDQTGTAGSTTTASGIGSSLGTSTITINTTTTLAFDVVITFVNFHTGDSIILSTYVLSPL